jgi:uncharacterized metal-binding protein YceD (DUF177 family)
MGALEGAVVSLTVRKRYTLQCDRCPAHVTLWAETAVAARAAAAWTARWRRDKLGQDVCPAHPKLKGARHA